MPENLGTVVTWVIGQVGDVMDVVVQNPILLISVGIFVVGAAIGLFKRLV